MKKPRYYRPRLECLEARDVPAFDVWQSDAILYLKGSRGADTVLIEDLGNNDIQITQGTTSAVYSGINRINMKAGPGDDVVTYSVISPSVKLWLDINLGSGNDNFEGAITLLPEGGAVAFTSTRRLPADNVHRVDVDGEQGNDNITLTAEGLLPAGVSLQANLRGGSGRDNILTSFAGQNDGEVKIRLDGQSGDDNVAAIFGRATAPSSINNGNIDVRVEGGSGRDTLNAWLGVDSGDVTAPSEGVVNVGTLNIKLDGQSGDDSVNFLAGVGNAFASSIVNGGNLNVKVEGGSGADSVLADVGGEIDNGLGELVFNFANAGTFNLTTEGNSGRDIVTNVVWLDNSGTGSFRGKSSGGLSRDDLYYELRRAGDNAANVLATLYAGPLDDPVLASAIVQVLNSKRVTIIPEVM
jgi:hypothetical protein